MEIHWNAGERMMIISSPTISSLANRLETARENYQIFQKEGRALHQASLQTNRQQIWTSVQELEQVRSTLGRYSAIKDSASKEMEKQDVLDQSATAANEDPEGEWSGL